MPTGPDVGEKLVIKGGGFCAHKINECVTKAKNEKANSTMILRDAKQGNKRFMRQSPKRCNYGTDDSLPKYLTPCSKTIRQMSYFCTPQQKMILLPMQFRYGFPTRSDVEFLVDVVNMRAHGSGADKKFLGNRLVPKTFGKHLEDFFFALGQTCGERLA